MESQHTEPSPLSNLQREMLKLFAKDVSEKDLIAIRQLIGQYFAEKAMDLADESWQEKGWTNEDAEKLLKTKMRTP
jgi:hypothetical protein